MDEKVWIGVLSHVPPLDNGVLGCSFVDTAYRAVFALSSVGFLSFVVLSGWDRRELRVHVFVPLLFCETRGMCQLRPGIVPLLVVHGSVGGIFVGDNE